MSYKSCTIYKDKYINFLRKNYRNTYKMLINDKDFLVKQIVYSYLYRNGYLCDSNYTKVVDSTDDCFIYFVIDFYALFKKHAYLYCYFSYVFSESYYKEFIKLFSSYAPLEAAC